MNLNPFKINEFRNKLIYKKEVKKLGNASTANFMVNLYRCVVACYMVMPLGKYAEVKRLRSEEAFMELANLLTMSF